MQKEIAVVTGASSGIGREIAKQLSAKGYGLILVARRKDRLEEVRAEVDTSCEVITADLSLIEDCMSLYEKASQQNVTILINCAGVGAFGEFTEVDMEKELQMIDVNIRSLHILTKLFLKIFKQKNKGYILNVSSVAGLLPAGPYMATYYASKAYVTSLTLAISQELADEGSDVYVGALCPGPVDTEFNEVAKVSFGLGNISATECASYGLKKMFKRKTIIVPGTLVNVSTKFSRVVPRKILVRIVGRQQKKKRK